jgi:UDP-N-acetylmuramate dehydrogenase
MLQHDVDLSSLNTLRLPARAGAYARIASPTDLAALRKRLPEGRRLILGGGSNLVLSGDFNGTVLHMAIGGRELVSEDAEAWYVAAGGGEDWSAFVDWTLAQGWPGLENLTQIPGTVGAAPVQNIGAYGLELCERFHSLEAIDLDTGTAKTFDLAACRFAYRDSVFKEEGWHRSGRYAIVRVVFRLPKRWSPVARYADVAAELAAQHIEAPDARQVADAVAAVRRRKLPDPAVLPNAGSFFQNPVVDLVTATKLGLTFPGLPRYPQPDGRVKLAAGWLIEQAGWKGRDLGPVGMYERQALVLVNREPGIARGTDVGLLAEAVRTDVKRRFGVALVPEPIFI